MRKNRKGRPLKYPTIKEEVRKLRIAGFSFAEIAKILNLKSRQTARYYFTSYPQETLDK